MAPVLSEEFLDIQATIECRFTLKLVCNMIIPYTQTYSLQVGVIAKCKKIIQESLLRLYGVLILILIQVLAFWMEERRNLNNNKNLNKKE